MFKILNILLSNGFTNFDKLEIFLKIKLKVDILEFDDLISKLYDLKLEKKGFFRHPLFGRINLKLTLSFYNFHFNHHKFLIEKIISKL